MSEKFAWTKFLHYLCKRKLEAEDVKKYMSQKTDVFCDILFCVFRLCIREVPLGGKTAGKWVWQTGCLRALLGRGITKRRFREGNAFSCKRNSVQTLILACAAMALKACGWFMARSASTLRLISIPAFLSAHMSWL